jgi:TonB family protein
MNPRFRIMLCAGFLAAAPAVAQAPATDCPAAVSEELMRAQPVAERNGGAMAAAIRDSVRTTLWQAARAAGVARPEGIVFARMARGSGEVRVWSYGSSLSEAVARDAVRQRAALLACWPEPDREVFFHVRLDSLPVRARGEVARMPELLTAREFAADMARISRRATSDPLQRSQRVTVEMRMLVSRDGTVAFAELVRGTTRGEVDRAVLEAAQRMRFRPAAARGGESVDVWVEQPVEVQIQG